ncbi:MAG: hypothetical protein IAF02_11270 [Anaerolineae bacterium]|nr:hypothetical protein [Anaerolineae bacterium]
MIILDKSAAHHNDLLVIQNHLLMAQYLTEQVNRKLANSTDTQAAELFGLPTANIPALKTVMTNVEAALKTSAVENLLGQLS